MRECVIRTSWEKLQASSQFNSMPWLSLSDFQTILIKKVITLRKKLFPYQQNILGGTRKDEDKKREDPKNP